MKEIVTFLLSGKEYGVEVSGMQGIENYVPITPVVDAPECLKGIIIIRDEVIPVIDIKKHLVLPPAEVTGDTKYLIFNTSYGKMACMADGISKICRVSGEGVQDFPPILQTETTGYVDFIARNEERLVVVIKPENILTEEDWKAINESMAKVEEEND
ncbi:MAG: chemotaxis protein CheW [Lachnospiraceae bacterium]|nr:chemotaxis protein CheW [Lachnospiraceae bacterium]